MPFAEQPTPDIDDDSGQCRAPCESRSRPCVHAAYVFALVHQAVTVAPVHAQAQTGPSDAEPQIEAGQTVIISDTDPRAGDIIVTAGGHGAALVEPETELNEEEIGRYGASTIGELLKDIGPIIDGSGNEPAILVNGQRLGAASGVNGYPPEALDRVAVLPPEAAARYGYPGNRRVVNLVLKSNFASWLAEAGLTVPTAGGRDSENVSAGRIVIDGATHWNVQLQLSRDSALLKSERAIPPRGDPAAPVASNAHETLLPAARTMAFNAGVTRPLGSFSGAFSINATSNSAHGLLGIAAASDAQPLRSEQNAQSLGLSLLVAGAIDDWQTTLSTNYLRTWNDGFFEQDGPLLTQRNRSKGETLGAQLNISKAIVVLPAGPLSSNITISADRSRSRNWRGNRADDPGAVDTAHNNRLNGQLSLYLPLLRGGDEGLGRLGELSADFAAGAQKESGVGLQSRFSGAISWSPFPLLRLRGSFEYQEIVPSFDQLHGPQIQIVNRVYDFVWQEFADPVWSTSGNPGLDRGSRKGLSLSAMLRPFENQVVTLNLDYRSQVAKGAVAGFPSLTPVIEAAFPERITRDASGRLVAVDARPINIARDSNAQLSTSLIVQLPVPAPSAKAAGGTVKAGSPWQVAVTLNHRWQLENALLVHAGMPVIDQLGDDGGQSRHDLSLQIVAARRGIGANLSGNWSSPSRARFEVAPDVRREFHFRSPLLFNLGLFVEPEHLREQVSWLKDLRLAIDVQNLFRGYRRAMLADGSTAPGYSRDEVDPLGRTIRLSIRKRF